MGNSRGQPKSLVLPACSRPPGAAALFRLLEVQIISINGGNRSSDGAGALPTQPGRARGCPREELPLPAFSSALVYFSCVFFFVFFFLIFSFLFSIEGLVWELGSKRGARGLSLHTFSLLYISGTKPRLMGLRALPPHPSLPRGSPRGIVTIPTQYHKAFLVLQVSLIKSTLVK